MELKDNYLKEVFSSERKIKIISMSHNAYFYPLQALDSNYENIQIDIFDASTSYIKIGENQGYTLESADIIIFYSPYIYDEGELERIKDIAATIVQTNQKRVTIGYAYVMPIEEREKKHALHEVKIVSLNIDSEYSEVIPTEQFYNPFDLMDTTLQVHDELNNQYKRKRKSNDNLELL